MISPVTSLVPMDRQQREKLLTVLASAVNEGSDEAADQLIALCNQFPELWQRISGIEAYAIDSWIDLLALGNSKTTEFKRAVVVAELDRQRQLLAQAGDSPLEKMLIGRIVSAWLQANYTDALYAQALGSPMSSPKLIDLRQRNAEKAQRQLLRAIQALATTRRLLGPTTVNIAQNQINIAG